MSGESVSGVGKLLAVMRRVSVSPFVFLKSTAFSFSAAVFESISFAVMIPLVQGIFEKGDGFQNGVRLGAGPIKLHLQNDAFTTTHYVIALVLAIFLASCFKNICVYISSLNVELQIARFGHNLRNKIFSSFLQSGKEFFDQNNMGHLSQILLGFTNELMFRLAHVNHLFYHFFNLIGYVAFMMWISWKLSLISFLIYPVMYVSLSKIIRLIEKTAADEAGIKVSIHEKISNILMCIPLLKSYSREKEESDSFSGMSNTLSQLQFSIGKKSNLIPPFQETFIVASTLLLIAIAGLLIYRDHVMSPSRFLVFFVIMRRAMTAFSNINSAQASIAVIAGASNSILKALDQSEKLLFISGDKSYEGLRDIISVKNLTFSYGRNESVLKNLSVDFAKGKTTALVGESGSGKTTLVSLLLRFYDCPEKSIFIDGVDIRDYDIKQIRKHIAFVSQESAILNATIKDNLIYGLDEIPSEAQLWDCLKRSQLDKFVRGLPLQLNTVVGDRGVQLSGGERQRVSIARAMLKGAEVLILDEATSALDSVTERLVQAAIEEALKGKTSIVIAHRLSTVQKADKIVVLQHGSVVEQGTFSELMKLQRVFFKYWDNQKLSNN